MDSCDARAGMSSLFTRGTGVKDARKGLTDALKVSGILQNTETFSTGGTEL